jgi:hypothetical protein
MARTATKRARNARTTPAATIAANAPWQRRLTQLAFLLTLVLVIVRMSMEEILRGAWLAVPGSTPVPAMPGPATSIGLDLLCCVPALLVLGRSALDQTFRLRFAWSFVPMFGLAIWTLASVFWASDKFASLVSAFNWSAALVLLWSTAQLVHSGLRLRLVAAAAFGLLLVLLVQGYYYRFVDLPDLQQNWMQHHGDLLKEQGALASSTEAGQIEKNIMGGVPTGFNVSRNTYAAVLVLLMVIAAGVMLQRRADGDGYASLLAILPAIALGLVMLYAFVQSKTAFATPVIAAGLLAILWRYRPWISAHATKLYWWGVGLFVLLIAAVVGHGLKHGTLVHVSLTFRWQYWVGAARVFVHHPWLGTGWANFGSWYTAYRLPQAAEEPSDPHNFLVRAFVELGVVGGILMIAWILRLWREWTVARRHIDDASLAPHAGAKRSAAPDPAANYPGFSLLIALAVIAIFANAATSIDWTAQWALIVLEVFKRLLFLFALLAGLSLVGIRSFRQQHLDDRPAPWLLTAILVGLGLFLIHNLIDFSMFETGPMFLFALLAGAALGMRLPAVATARSHRRAAAITVVFAGIVLLLAAGMVWVPIVTAEALAQEADEAVRSSRQPDAPPEIRPDRRKVDSARDSLVKAFRLVPFNGDYAFRAEQASLLDGNANAGALRALLDEAIAADPRKIRYLNARAGLEAMTGNLQLAATDDEQILRLDPHNLELRLQYAAILERLGRRDEAIANYQKVLEFNAQLAPDEIRRLSPRQVDEIRAKIGSPGADRSG